MATVTNSPPIIAIAMAACLSACVLEGEVIFEDDFDSENDRAGVVNYEDFDKWDVVEGSVDLIGNDFYDFFPGNGLYVDLDGTTSEAGTLSTKAALSLEAGAYTLGFWLAGPHVGGADTVTVALGDVFEEEITLASGEPFAYFEREVDVASPTEATLTFALSGGDNEGILLDNVSVSTDL